MWQQTVRITFSGVTVWAAFHATWLAVGEVGATIVLREK